MKYSVGVSHGVAVLVLLMASFCLQGVANCQTPQTTKPPTPNPTPAPVLAPTPEAKPSPESTPFQVPSMPAPAPAPSVTTPTSSPTPVSLATGASTSGVLTLEDALRLANVQASTLQAATINEQIAGEDLKQAQAALLPRVSAPLSYIYTSPALGLKAGEPRGPSFVANNGIGEYEALVNVSGDFDIAGRLRATVARNRALLAAAHAGSEVARRALAETVLETYYGLALATAERVAAAENLAAAENFEHITSLLLTGGEIASVDLTRAQLQTLARRDELEKARANEIVAAGALRILIGYDFTRPLSTSDLSLVLPDESELLRFSPNDLTRQPLITQLELEVRAAEQDIKIARADRLPQLTYSMNGGFDTDSLKGPRLKEHTGVSAALSLSIPVFDWGATKSKERQAQLRVKLAQNEQALTVRGLTQQFYSALTQAQSAAVRVRLARDGILRAQANLAASIARYRAGEAQIIEVTDAQTTLVTQRAALYQALFDYQTALGRLKQATGQ